MIESCNHYQNAVTKRSRGIFKHELIIGNTDSALELFNEVIEMSIYDYNSKRSIWGFWMNSRNKKGSCKTGMYIIYK